MAAFCRRHSYRGGKSPAELLRRLRSAPTAVLGLPTSTVAATVHTHVQHLRTLQSTIKDIEGLIRDRLQAHPRAQLLQTLPGAGRINLAQLLAEVGPILDRVTNAEQAAAECGATPVTRASGKTSGVYFRWAANTRARKAITAFAHNARLQPPWAGKLYADARSYQRFAPQRSDGTADPAYGLREFVVGTGGDSQFPLSNIDRVTNLETGTSNTFGVLDMHLNPDGYSWQFLPARSDGNGTYTDSGTATCHGAPRP